MLYTHGRAADNKSVYIVYSLQLQTIRIINLSVQIILCLLKRVDVCLSL